MTMHAAVPGTTQKRRVQLEFSVNVGPEQISTLIACSWCARDTRAFALQLADVQTRLELLALEQEKDGAP